MTGSDPETQSVPSGFICIMHTQSSAIDIYQLVPFMMNGAISQMCYGGMFLASPIQSTVIWVLFFATRNTHLPPELSGPQCPVLLAGASSQDPGVLSELHFPGN